MREVGPVLEKSFSLELYRLLKSKFKDLEISKQGMDMLSRFIYSLAHTLAKEAGKEASKTENGCMTSLEVQKAVRLLLPVRLARDVNSHAVFAVCAYSHVVESDTAAWQTLGTTDLPRVEESAVVTAGGPSKESTELIRKSPKKRADRTQFVGQTPTPTPDTMHSTQDCSNADDNDFRFTRCPSSSNSTDSASPVSTGTLRTCSLHCITQWSM